MKNDPKIKVDRKDAKQIAEIICSEINDSIGHNQRIYDLASRCEKQYSQISKWAEAGKICDSPFKGAADYFVALTEWIIDAVHVRVMMVLFGQEPYMSARGVEASDVDKAGGVTDFTDMILREQVHVRKNMELFFKQMIKLPFSVIKYDWVQEFDKMITKERAITFINPETGEQQYVLPNDIEGQLQATELMMNGWQQGEETDVWTEKEKELINSPQLQYINFKDYVWCSHTKRNKRAYWEGDRCWLTINDMRLKVLQDKFIEESVNKVIASMDIGDKAGAEKVIAQRAELRECFHWYGRLPFNKNNKIDFDDPKAFEQEVYCLVDYKEEELLEIKHWDYQRTPFPDRVYLRGEFEPTERFEGRSLAQKLYQTQKYSNQFYNTIMNNAWFAMQKIFVKRKTLQGDDWEKPEVYPGAMWEEDMPGDIRVLDIGDVKTIGWEIQQSLLDFAERLSNISIYQTGTARKEGGQKTLGEIESTIREGNMGMDRFIQNCHMILKTICQWTVDYYHDRMPPGLERRIRGESGEMIFPTQENMSVYQEKGINPYWTNEDIAGKYDFDWKGTSLSSNKEWQLAVANDLQDRYLQVPLVAGNLLAVWSILKKGLEARNIKDWESILPSKEAIVAEMKRMQAQAQMQDKQLNAPAPEELAVQKLEQQGMPREQAIQMIQERTNNVQGSVGQAQTQAQTNRR